MITYWDNIDINSIVEENADGVIIEEWKDIVGFDGQYQISNFGRVKSLKCYFKSVGIRILRPSFDKDGYVQVILVKGGQRFNRRIHQLVANAFIDNPENHPVPNHKKGIKTDNRASQLEWVTHSDNIKHSYEVLGRIGKTNMKGRIGADHPLSKKLIQKSKLGEVIATYNGTAEAARETGFGRKGIGKACQGIKKSYKGFKWEYI